MTIQLGEDDFTKHIQPGDDFQKEREPRQFYGGKSKSVGTWGGGHCVLKWDFTQTFPGNQDATLK